MVSVLALMGNLVFALVLFIASVIPRTWSGTDGNESINKIFDEQYGGTWFIIVGSSAAFLSSAIINNVLNWLIGQCFKGDPDSFCAFALRSYISTAIGQFIDNFVFAIIVSYHF